MQKIESILLFLTLLFLPTQLGKHFWPEFSYIYSLKIDYLSPTLYFWDLLVILLVAVWFMGKPKINKLAFNLFLFFIFAQALSLIGASSVGAGLVRLEQYLIAGLFGIYLASSKNIKSIFLPLALGLMGESLLAIGQFIKGQTLGFWILGERTFTISTPGIAKFDFYGRQFLRPYGTFPHPNVLAGYLLVAGLLTRKPFVLVISFLEIFLTMSRAAIFAGFVSAIFLKRKSIKFIIFIIIITIIFFPILFTRFSSLLNFDSLAVLRREELLANAWQMFVRNHFLGVGLNNYIPAAAGSLITGPNRFLQPVHNILFLVLAETGIIGFIGLIGLIGIPIFRKKFLLCWGVILFLGLFDHYFLTLPQGYRLLFLVWGLSFTKGIVK